MKKTFTLTSLIFLLFLWQGAFAQNFQTVRSGNWNQAQTWAGGNIPPTGAHNRTIQVNEGHNVNFSGSFSNGNNTSIIVKGSLTINSWHFSMGNNSKLLVEGIFRNASLFRMGNGATIQVSGQLANNGHNFQIGHDADISVAGTLTNTSSMVYGNSATVNVSGQVTNSGYTFTFGNSLFLSVLFGGNLTTSTRFISGQDGQFVIEGNFSHTGYEFRVGQNTAIWVSGSLSASNNWSFSPGPNTQIYNCNELNLNNFQHTNVQFLDCVLPIELLSFTAQYQNKQVLLQWSTGSEINNDFFSLERSSNTFDSEVIGYVDGAGNSSQTLHYHFIDKEPLPGITYYRLKQTDFDGSYAYSEWVAVEAEDHAAKLRATAISQPEGLMLRVSAPTEKPIQIQLIDLHGRVIHTQELNPGSPGQIENFIKMPQSAPSVLLFRVSDGQDVVSGKVIR